MQKKSGPILVCIRDGWGYRLNPKENRIIEGNTPNTDYFMSRYPNSILDAAGKAVGLPDGYMGNSEVGHLTIGSGRILNQSMVRINKSIIDGSFYKNDSLLKAIYNCKTFDSTMHIIALLQYEGVHSLYSHLYAAVDLCRRDGIKKVCIHIITDGRDARVNAAKEKIERFEEDLKRIGVGAIATISGRFYAMDRDKRWDRTKKAFEAIVDAKCDTIVPLEDCYATGETDEFLIPRKKDWYKGIKKHDSCFFVNFRTDRPRQLTKAIIEKDFNKFPRRTDIIDNICFVAMTKYYENMNALVAFEDLKIDNHLGEVISNAGLKQLRISETEKYAHVTFFFNGEKETPYNGEDRIMIPSPKVATYDLKPEMSAREITSKIIEKLTSKDYDVIITNIVNGDMVGHTGVKQASLSAVSVVDECVGRLANKIIELNGTALFFADHGNVEDQTEMWRTSHTKNPVPFMLISNEDYKIKSHGGLRDIAPTVLDLLGICKPKEMTGESLILRKEGICKMIEENMGKDNGEQESRPNIPPNSNYAKKSGLDTDSKTIESKATNVVNVIKPISKDEEFITDVKPIANNLESAENIDSIKTLKNDNFDLKIPLDVPESKKEEYKKNYLDITKGTGRLMLFAGDQKIEHLNKDFYGDGITLEDNNPRHFFDIASKANIGVFATQLGLFCRYGMDYPNVPYLIKLNSKTNIIPTSQKDPRSGLLSDIDQVVEVKKNSKLNILGVGYTLYLGSEYEADMLEEVSFLIYEAHKNGLIFVLWIYPRGKAVSTEKDPHLIAGATGTAACLGADFVKVSYPEKEGELSEEALKEAVEAAGRTGVVCAGGGTTDAEVFLDILHKQIHISKAKGNATGRNIHQRPLNEAVKFCNAIYAITIEDKSVDDALKIYYG